jgi:hypothetical protein
MGDFEELLSNVSKDELSVSVPSRLDLDDSLENIVFKKIINKKQQFQRNIAISIIFMIFGAFFGYLIINNASIKNDRATTVHMLANSTNTTNIKLKEKKEIWASDDVYFSTYDDNTSYAIEQVSMTNDKSDKEF